MPWWLWLLVGVVALAGESVSTALFLLNVGIAALVATVLSLAAAPLVAQIGAFVVLSVLLIGLARPRMMALLLRHRAAPVVTMQGPPDRIATVTEMVTPSDGTIRVGHAEFWTARANSPLQQIEVGARVRIARVEGLIAYVDPISDMGVARRESSAEPALAAEPIAGLLHVASEPATFSALLRQHRLAARLTQEALAERARLSARAISDLERGVHRSAQRDTARLLADALHLSEPERAEFEAAARRLAEPAPVQPDSCG